MELDIDEIVTSQLKMIKKIHDKDKTYRYFTVRNNLILHLMRIKKWLKTKPNFDVIYVNYNDLIKSPDKQLIKIMQFLNVKSIKLSELKAVIDKSLYRTQNKKN
jgi:hypothetical protein